MLTSPVISLPSYSTAVGKKRKLLSLKYVLRGFTKVHNVGCFQARYVTTEVYFILFYTNLGIIIILKVYI